MTFAERLTRSYILNSPEHLDITKLGYELHHFNGIDISYRKSKEELYYTYLEFSFFEKGYAVKKYTQYNAGHIAEYISVKEFEAGENLFLAVTQGDNKVLFTS